MDNVIIKYSDWFDDDGGFEKIRSEFKTLGDDLIKEAKRIKDGVNIFDLSNSEGIKQYEESAEKLTESFKEYAEAKKQITKIENEYVKRQKASIKATELQTKNLAELEEKLAEYRLDLKKTNAEEKLGVKTGKKSAEIRADLKIKIKAVTKEISTQQKEILESNKLSKTEEKLLKANIVLQKDRAETLSEVRERLSALRLVASQVNITTAEGQEQLEAYNAEIDELTEVLEQNSDKFIQNKINVGNYEESIVNALKQTSLFSGELSFLNGIVDKMIDTLKSSEKATEANTRATQANTRANVRFGKSLRVLNRIVKASVILLLITAVASLASVFNQGRAGVVATQKALARFNAISKVTINLLAGIGKGLLDIFGALFSGIGNFFSDLKIIGLEIKQFFLEVSSPFGGAKDEIAAIERQIVTLKAELKKSRADNDGFAKGWDKIKNSVAGFGDAYDNAVKGIKLNDEGIIRAFEIADEIRKAELGLIRLRKEVRLLEIESDDSTRSLRQQLDSTDQLLAKRVELLKEEASVAKQQLALANAKARVDAQLAGFELSKNEVEFAKQLLDLNIRLSERRGENPLDDNLLEESQEALKNYLTVLDEVDIAEVEIAKQRREIQRDLFEQNLDLLIDLIDTEKNLNEQQVNDITKNFRDRVIEFNNFITKFQANAKAELNEFTKFAKQSGQELEFDIQFNDDGSFDVLVNDTKLSIDNVVELNKELQNLGLAEIPINRFREFVVETRNGVRDFIDINKELTITNIKVAELKDNLTVGDEELTGLRQLQKEIQAIQNGRDFNDLSQKERDAILKKTEEFEKRKTDIQEKAEEERQRNRIKAIDSELATVEKGSVRYYELLQERNDIERSLAESNIDRIQQKLTDANNKATEEYKKFQEEVRAIINAVLDEVVKSTQKEVDAQEKKIDTQDEILDEQRRRAEQGLSNTLAFEQRERAKQEAELIKRQKRLERLEKIKMVYTSYSNYANQGEQNPILKALRDFAILEAITASFGDGGIVGIDGVRTNSNGITRGRSHNKKGGVLAFHEGGEGFFSRREVQNMGEANFRYIKSIAGMGPLDTNFFSGQQRDFSTLTSVTLTDPRLIEEVRGVKDAIKSKPDQSLSVPEVVDGVLKFTETITKGNKIKRNHYRIKKPKI